MSLRGDFRYMVFDENFDSQVFLKFLKRLMRGRKRPVMLFMDSHPSHKTHAIKEYVRSTQGKLEIHFLPKYSPEMNPQEYGWNCLKSHSVYGRSFESKEVMKKELRSSLRGMQKKPSLVKNFFKAKDVAYTWQ
jgi:transposase